MENRKKNVVFTINSNKEKDLGQNYWKVGSNKLKNYFDNYQKQFDLFQLDFNGKEGNLGKQRFLDQFQKILKEKNLEKIIIHFSGHSDKSNGGWIFYYKGDKTDTLCWEEIIQEWGIRENKLQSKLLIISDTCYSNQWVQKMKENSKQKKNKNVNIQSSSGGKSSFCKEWGGYLTHNLLKLSKAYLNQKNEEMGLKQKIIKLLKNKDQVPSFFEWEEKSQNFIEKQNEELNGYEKQDCEQKEKDYQNQRERKKQKNENQQQKFNLKYQEEDILEFGIIWKIQGYENLGQKLKILNKDLKVQWMEDLYEGERNVKGERNGKGKQVYYNGSQYEGIFLNDMYHGKGELVYPDKDQFQRKKYRGEFFQDQMHGKGEFEWKNGDKYVGEWKKGIQEGIGLFYKQDQLIYQGYFKNGAFEGLGTFRYNNNKVSQPQNNLQSLNYSISNININEEQDSIQEAKKLNLIQITDEIQNSCNIQEYEIENLNLGLSQIQQDKEREYEAQEQNNFSQNQKLEQQKQQIQKNLRKEYQGNWKKGQFNGRGSLVWEDGSKYEGEFLNGKRQGKGIMYDVDQKIIYEGDWIGDKCEGQGIFYFPQNKEILFLKYIGQFKFGQKNGNGKIYFNDNEGFIEGTWNNENLVFGKQYDVKQRVKYEGEFQNYKWNGKGIQYFYNDKAMREIYSGNFKQNQRDGEGKMNWKDGKIYQGNWENGKRNGQGKMFKLDFVVYEGKWKNDKFEGEGTFYYDNDKQYQKFIGEWKEGNKLKGNFEDKNGNLIELINK